MKIILSHRLKIIEPPDQMARKVRTTFIIKNPRWFDNDRMSRWNGGADHWLTFFSNHPGGFMTTLTETSAYYERQQTQGKEFTEDCNLMKKACGGLNMNRLEGRLSKLERSSTEAPVSIMNDLERAAKVAYIFNNPHKFDYKAVSRLTEIIYMAKERMKAAQQAHK